MGGYLSCFLVFFCFVFSRFIDLGILVRVEKRMFKRGKGREKVGSIIGVVRVGGYDMFRRVVFRLGCFWEG